MTDPANSQVRISFGGPATPVVRTLILINVIVYAFMVISKLPPNALYSLLGLSPVNVVEERQFWQLFTYLFMHDMSIWHVATNMLTLYFFGPDMERLWGSRRFAWYYLAAGVFAGLVVILSAWGQKSITIGASGATMAVLLAYGLYFPRRTILLFFVIPISAWLMVLLTALLEVWVVMGTRQGGVNHWAHIGGLAFGLLWYLHQRGRLRLPSLKHFWRRRRARARLKMIRGSSGPTVH